MIVGCECRDTLDPPRGHRGRRRVVLTGETSLLETCPCIYFTSSSRTSYVDLFSARSVSLSAYVSGTRPSRGPYKVLIVFNRYEEDRGTVYPPFVSSRPSLRGGSLLNDPRVEHFVSAPVF